MEFERYLYAPINYIYHSPSDARALKWKNEYSCYDNTLLALSIYLEDYTHYILRHPIVIIPLY